MKRYHIWGAWTGLLLVWWIRIAVVRRSDEKPIQDEPYPMQVVYNFFFLKIAVLPGESTM